MKCTFTDRADQMSEHDQTQFSPRTADESSSAVRGEICPNWVVLQTKSCRARSKCKLSFLTRTAEQEMMRPLFESFPFLHIPMSLCKAHTDTNERIEEESAERSSADQRACHIRKRRPDSIVLQIQTVTVLQTNRVRTSFP